MRKNGHYQALSLSPVSTSEQISPPRVGGKNTAVRVRGYGAVAGKDIVRKGGTKPQLPILVVFAPLFLLPH